MQTIAKKWGNSIGIRIPATIANELKITDGTEVTMERSGNTLVLERKKYTLKELTDRITSQNRHDEIDWGEPVGREI